MTERSYCNLKLEWGEKKKKTNEKISGAAIELRKREERIRMRYVNKLAERERRFGLMAQHYNLALQGREK